MTDERDPLRDRQPPVRQEPDEAPTAEDSEELEEPDPDAAAQAEAEARDSQAEGDDEGELTPV